jgi:hypothetical protein
VDLLKVDTKKLSEAPQALTIIKLLAVSNDVKMLGFLGNLVMDTLPGKVAENPALVQFQEGVRWYLFRQRVSIATEGITSIMWSIRANRKQKALSKIWALINSDEKLLALFKAIEEYLPEDSGNKYPEGQYYKFLENNRFVRDKMTAHYDNVIIGAIDQSLAHGANSGLQPIDYWLNDDTNYGRALFIDTLLAVNWYQAHKIPLASIGSEAPELLEAFEHTQRILSSFTMFADVLSIKFCLEYQILDSQQLQAIQARNASA